MASGTPITQATEVFNPHALTQIWEKGIGGIFFLFLFVFIPLALGMYKLISSTSRESITKREEDLDNTSNRYHLPKIHCNWGLVGIIIIDVFIAYKVAANISFIENAKGEAKSIMQVTDLWKDGNFWLVFALGTLGVYLFSLFINKLFEQFEHRNPTAQQAKTKHEIAIYDKKINKVLDEISDIKILNDKLDIEISDWENDKANLLKRVQNIPIIQNEQIKELELNLLSFKEKITTLANIYKNQIDNDRLPLSKTELENRVSVFMEGWSKYLFEIFSEQIAKSKNKEALNESEVWLNTISIVSDNK